MQNPATHASPSELNGPTRPKARLRVALGIALVLHVLILLLPIDRQVPERTETPAQIELQLTHDEPPQKPVESLAAEPVPKPSPELLPLPVPTPALADQTTSTPEVTPPGQVQTFIPINRDYEKLSSEEKVRLTHTILGSQFITQETVADRLFGKPVVMESKPVQKEFHYPIQPNLVSMLDKPMQELPFAYQPGLVRFAYAPGVKGDLQRFWDVITPEFGWTTKYGTEVRCIWVLVIAGCGWK